MIRTLIVDDEPLARERLRTLLQPEPDIQIIGECADGRQAVLAMTEQAPDLVFLDIQMPGLDGMGVLQAMTDRPLPVVVFVTAYDRHAIEAFELAALDYVLKPIRRDRLAETVDRVLREVGDRQVLAARQEEAIRGVLRREAEGGRLQPLRRLPVRHRREVRLLDLDQVNRIISRERLVLACAEGREYLVDYTLQELETRLPEGQFLRVHRAVLVNVSAIESYGGEDGVLVLRLKDGTKVEASERRAAEVRRRLK